jgi:hypothetical protein
MKGITSKAGLRDYLVLLSLCGFAPKKKIFIERKRLERAAELFNEGTELQEVTKEVVGIDGCSFKLAENCVRNSRTHRQDRQPVLH